MSRLLSFFLLLGSSSAFMMNVDGTHHQQTRLYYHFMEPSDGSELSPELQELDQARQHFEKLMQIEADRTKVLTSSERQRREREISLLKQLAKSNTAADDLVELWRQERDEQSARILLKMQGPCSAGLVEEEVALRRMTQEHEAWAEPFSRLATLLFFKGEFSEAIEMAERAALLKPWHFEVLQISGKIAQQNITDDTVLQRAKRLADKALPELEDNSRSDWIQNAIIQAHHQLEDAEVMTAIVQCTFVELAEDEIWQ